MPEWLFTWQFFSWSLFFWLFGYVVGLRRGQRVEQDLAWKERRAGR